MFVSFFFAVDSIRQERLFRAIPYHPNKHEGPLTCAWLIFKELPQSFGNLASAHENSCRLSTSIPNRVRDMIWYFFEMKSKSSQRHVLSIVQRISELGLVFVKVNSMHCRHDDVYMKNGFLKNSNFLRDIRHVRHSHMSRQTQSILISRTISELTELSAELNRATKLKRLHNSTSFLYVENVD